LLPVQQQSTAVGPLTASDKGLRGVIGRDSSSLRGAVLEPVLAVGSPNWQSISGGVTIQPKSTSWKPPTEVTSASTCAPRSMATLTIHTVRMRSCPTCDRGTSYSTTANRTGSWADPVQRGHPSVRRSSGGAWSRRTEGGVKPYNRCGGSVPLEGPFMLDHAVRLSDVRAYEPAIRTAVEAAEAQLAGGTLYRPFHRNSLMRISRPGLVPVDDSAGTPK
jgi:hypothetical protein